MILRSVLLIWLLILTVPLVPARIYCPRVTSEHTADVSDWKRFREYPKWKDKEGQDLALAVWQYLCDYETGVYHFNEIHEGRDPFSEFSTVRDPQKILNIYNMGFCGIFGPVLDGIFQHLGFEEGRSFGINLWNHCATEVKYDGQWHYFDLDVRGLLLNRQGRVAGLQEARTDRDLWTNPAISIQPFFPNESDKGKVFEVYRDSRVDYNYRWFEGSHTMDYYLRQGESFTRWWEPQGGRWNHVPLYNEVDWVRELIQTQPVGMKPNHRDFTPWNHGNGLFHYEPDLTQESTDFEDGVDFSQNLEPGLEGLEFVKDGNAEAIFEVFSPYIIVARVNGLDDEADDTEASQITLDCHTPVDLALSLDHGRTWQSVGTLPAGKSQRMDFTRWVKGTYGYRVKLSSEGKSGEWAIQNLRIDTWVQVAPISLPRLRQGPNRLRYDRGDHYGLETEPVLVSPNVADPADLKKHVVDLPEDYAPKRFTSRIQGEAVLRLEAPLGKSIAWFSVGATFQTHQGEQAGQTHNQIAYALDQPQNYRTIYDASVPIWVSHWRYNWDTDVTLDSPAKNIYVRFTGDPGLSVIRACLHVRPQKESHTAALITHGYKIDGRQHIHKVEAAPSQEYTIDCAGEPENLFVTIACPSRRAKGEAKETSGR